MLSHFLASSHVAELTKLATSAASSNTRNILDDMSVERIEKLRDAHKKKREVIITANISEEDFGVLETIFPECNLKLEIRSENDHGIAAAARQCEYEVLLIRTNAGRCRVIDAGGNCPMYLRRMLAVHSCRPILSVRDAQRMVKLVNVIVRLLASDSATVDQKDKARQTLLAIPENFRPKLAVPLPESDIRPNEYLCTNSCEDCTVPADAIMTCHSAYDFNIDQQCEAMISHGASILHGSFLFEPAMIRNKRGFSSFLKYEWSIQKLRCTDQHPLGGAPCSYFGCDGHHIIDYSFRDDASFCYRHDYANIESMYRTSFRVVQGQTFVLEFHENRRGIQFYEITRIPDIYIPPSHLSRKLHFSSLADTCFVRVFRYNDYGHDADGKFYTRIETYPETIVTQTRRYVSTHKDEKCTIPDLITYISAADSTVAVAGAYVSYRHSLTANQIRELATSVFIEDVFHRVSLHSNIEQAKKHKVAYDRICEAKWYKLDSWKLLFHEVFYKFKSWLFGDYTRSQSAVGEDVAAPSPAVMARLIFGVRAYGELLPAFQTMSEPITFEQFYSGKKKKNVSMPVQRRYPKVLNHFDAAFANTELLAAQRHPKLVPTNISIRLRNCLNKYLTLQRDPLLFSYVLNYSDVYGCLASEIIDHYFYYDELLPAHLSHGTSIFFGTIPNRYFFQDYKALVQEMGECRHLGKSKYPCCDQNLIDVISTELTRLYHLSDFDSLYECLFRTEDYMITYTTSGNLLPRLDLPWLKRHEFWRFLVTRIQMRYRAYAELQAKLSFSIIISASQSHDMVLQNYSMLEKQRDNFFRDGINNYATYHDARSFPKALVSHIRAHTKLSIHKQWCQALEIWGALRASNICPSNGLIINDSPGHFSDLFHLTTGLRFDIINSIPSTGLISGLSLFGTIFNRTAVTRDVATVNTGGKYPLIISNTKTSRANTESQREEIHFDSLSNAINQIFKSLEHDGHAVLRCYGLAGSKTRILLSEIMSYFQDSYFLKLRSSCQLSSEKFLFLFNYQSAPIVNVDIQTKLIDFEDNFSSNLYEYSRQFYASYPSKARIDFNGAIADWLNIYATHIPGQLASAVTAAPNVRQIPPASLFPNNNNNNNNDDDKEDDDNNNNGCGPIPPINPNINDTDDEDVSVNLAGPVNNTMPCNTNASVYSPSIKITTTAKTTVNETQRNFVPTGKDFPIDIVITDSKEPVYKVTNYNDIIPVQNIKSHISHLRTRPYISQREIHVLNQIYATRVNCCFYEKDADGRISLLEFTVANLAQDPTIYIINDHAYIPSDPDQSQHITRFFRPYCPNVTGLRSMPGDGDCMLHAYIILTGVAKTPDQLRAIIIDYWLKTVPDDIHAAGATNFDSAAELRNYWSKEIEDNTKKAVADWKKVVINPKKIQLRKSWANAQYDIDGVIYLRRRKDGSYTPYYSEHRDLAVNYEYAFDGTRLVQITCKDNVITCDEEIKLLYVSKFLVLIQGPRLFESTKEFVYRSANVILQAGIAGAGKTYAIVNNCTNQDLILTALRDSAEETRTKVANAKKQTIVKTVDSYLINDRKPYENVYFDEAFSCHAGYVALVTAFTGCRNIYCYGDPNQIPAISRIAGFVFKNNQIHANTENFENVSKRCPADVCRAVNRLYLRLSNGVNLETRNPRLLSMKIKQIANVRDVPTEGADIVTWTQAEKKSLIQRYPGVKTIHEKQGATVRNLALVRTNAKSLPLYRSVQHAISAITRHTSSFVYYTVSIDKDDAVTSLIRNAPKTNLHKFQNDDLFPDNFDRRAGAIGKVEYIDKPKILYDSRGAAITDKYYSANQHLPTSAKSNGTLRRPYKSLQPLPNYSTAIGPRSSDPLKTAQQSYDTSMPIPVDYTEDFLTKQIEEGDISIFPNNLRWKRGKGKITAHTDYMEKFDLRSHARTAQPYPRVRCEKNTLLAINKRNMNAYHDCAPSDPDELSATVTDYVLDVIGIPDWRERSAFYIANPVRLSREALDGYLITAGSKDWHLFERELSTYDPRSITPEVLCKYECMIKEEPKNRLSTEVLGEYQALQTIIHHKSFVNLVMSIFREITTRFLELLDPRICVQIKKSPQELEDHINSYVKVLKFLLYEIDFSKFDKSQFWEALRIEMKVYGICGLDALLGQLWTEGFTEKQVRVVQYSITFFLYLQRTSGNVTTGLGNLIVNLFTNVYAMKLGRNDYHAITAVGDDSAFFLNRLLDTDAVTHSLYSYFNLEAKVLSGLGCYFCSAFFVYSGDRWLLMPDPIKKFERLSIPLRSTASETLFDRWNSLRDLCKNYYDASAIDSLDFQCQLRYSRGSIKGLVNAITSIMDDFEVFRSLYRD